MASAFSGFSADAFQFLVDLALNNDRAWFLPRKASYERLLKEPLEAFCVALNGELAARSIPLSADPARSPFRIYRDVRFSKDKSPYKTAASASFPWSGKGVEVGGGVGGGVGGYLHLEPGECFVGGGMWHPGPVRLGAWRSAVVADRARVHSILGADAFRTTFGTIDGSRLTRPPAGYSADDPDIELLKFKDVTFGRRVSDAEVGSPDLPALVADTLAIGVPLRGLLAALPADEQPDRR